MPSYTITSPSATSASQPASVVAPNAKALLWRPHITYILSLVVGSVRHWMTKRECLVADHLAPDTFRTMRSHQRADGLNAHLLRDINAPDWVCQTQARERTATDYELLRAQSQARRFF